MSTPWSKDVILDPGTFGNSRACHILVDMMNQNVIPVFEKHRVLAFITHATHNFNGISDITDLGVRYKVMYMMRDHYWSLIEKMNYSPKFLSYLRNVINYLARRAL